MLSSNKHNFASLLAAVSIALVAVMAAPIPSLLAAPRKLLIFTSQPSAPGAQAYVRLASPSGPEATVPVNDTSNAGFVSASITVRRPGSASAKNATRGASQRRAASEEGEETMESAVYWIPGIECNNNHAGWASDCGDGFWQDKAMWASTAAPENIGKNKWKYCKDTCCVVAKGGNGQVPTLGDMTTWARSAYGYCDGPNLQTWRSAVHQKYAIGDKGDFKMCLCNFQSLNKC